MNGSPVTIKGPLNDTARSYFRKWGAIGGKVGDRQKKSINGRRNAIKRWASLPRCPTCHRPLPQHSEPVSPGQSTKKPNAASLAALRELEQKEKERLRILQQMETDGAKARPETKAVSPKPQHTVEIQHDY